MKEKLDYLKQNLCDMSITQQQLTRISKDIYGAYNRPEYTEQQLREQMEAATYGYNLGFEMALDILIAAVKNGKLKRQKPEETKNDRENEKN